jgi:hypothetical protein
MKYDDITSAMRAFIGTHEVFRKLGFPAENLYCQAAPSARAGGRLSLFLTLKMDSNEFNVELGLIDNEEEAAKEHAKVCEEIKRIPADDLDRMYHECEAYTNKMELMMSLKKKGFL